MDFKQIIISGTTTIREALQLLDTSAKKSLFVVEDDVLIGAVSDGDVRRWILKSGDLNDSVCNIMNRNPITISEHNLHKAVDIMKKTGVAAIPVIDENRKIETVYFWGEDETRHFNRINSPVIIMAGGKGERLLPYTSVLPKPLIPIGDKPILEHIIESFMKFGCDDFTLTINYKKNMIKAYFDELERDYTISYIEEEIPLGTGGGLFFLKDKIKDSFFVSNCDILMDVDYSEIVRFHKNNQNLITIITSLKNNVIPYGVINLDEAGNVASIIEKPKTDCLINTGVYVLEPEVLDFLNENEFIHITELIEKCLLNHRKVGTYPISEDAWMDMGQVEEMEKMIDKITQ